MNFSHDAQLLILGALIGLASSFATKLFDVWIDRKEEIRKIKAEEARKRTQMFFPELGRANQEIALNYLQELERQTIHTTVQRDGGSVANFPGGGLSTRSYHEPVLTPGCIVTGIILVLGVAIVILFARGAIRIDLKDLSIVLTKLKDIAIVVVAGLLGFFIFRKGLQAATKR